MWFDLRLSRLALVSVGRWKFTLHCQLPRQTGQTQGQDASLQYLVSQSCKENWSCC